jgi:hypothetical protein
MEIGMRTRPAPVIIISLYYSVGAGLIGHKICSGDWKFRFRYFILHSSVATWKN